MKNWGLLLICLGLAGCRTGNPPLESPPSIEPVANSNAPTSPVRPVELPAPSVFPTPKVFTEAATVEIYAYINADTDLIAADGSAQGVLFAQELADEVAKIGDRAQLTTYLDPNSFLAKEGQNLETTLTIRRGNQILESPSLGETNSADIQTFQNFVASVRPDPQVYRVLILWGHGEGWQRVGGFDFSHPQTALSYQDLAATLPAGSFDLVIFDACKMATLETLQAWSKVTRHVIASQMKLPVEGIRYTGLADVLRGTELAQPADVTVQIYNQLKKTTLDYHKTKGIFVPLVLFASEGVATLNAALAPVLQELRSKVNQGALNFTEIAKASQPSFLLGLTGDAHSTVDLRALLATLEKKAQISGQNVLEKFKSLSHQAYGSLSLYFPEMTATGLQDEAEVSYSKRRSWTQGLANWGLIELGNERGTP